MKKLIYMLIFTSIMFAAQVDINLTVEDKVYHIGDRILLDYKISAGDKFVFVLPDIKEYLQDVELIGMINNKKLKRGKQIIDVNIEIVSFDTGFVHIPYMPLISTDSTGFGKPDTIFTPERYIYIYSVLDSSVAPLALKPPLPLSLMTWWEVLISLVLLGAAITVLIFGLRYRRVNKAIEEQIWQTPTEKAEFLLNALQNKQYPKNEKWKEFYLELTYIARDYFENVYYIHLQELVTSDLIPTLTEHLDIEKMNKMEEFFIFADLVKFAKGLAVTENCDRHLEVIKQIIDEGKKSEKESMD